MFRRTSRFFGSVVLRSLADTGRLSLLALRATDRAFLSPFRGEKIRIRETLEQVVRAGNRSLPLVMLISVLVGMILALQSAYQLRDFNALELVPALVSVSVTRELAPLLTAILVAGRVGSSIAAEIGTMKVSQEIDALTVMGIDPVPFLVVPRMVGMLVALPCITAFADLAGILGGCGIGVFVFDMNAHGFFSDGMDALTLQDLWGGLLKALVFAGIISLISCHQGLETSGGAEQVGRSTTTSVVRSIVLIIAADLFVTALLYVSK